jgi:hypothetical protein
MLRRRVAVGAGAVATAAAAGIAISIVATHATTATALPVANIWVDLAAKGQCQRLASPAAYSDAAACPSLEAAYSKAEGGDTILVRQGSYPSQTVPARSLGTNRVTIAKDPAGSAPTWPTLSVNASYVTADGFTSTGTTSERGIVVSGNNVTIANFSTQALWASGTADFLTLLHGNVGPTNGCSEPEDGIQTGTFFSDITTDVTIDDVSVHGTSGFTQCGVHMDGIQAAGCQRWVIRNSHFWDNDTSHVLCLAHDSFGASPVDGLVLENNEFGKVNNVGNGVILYCGTGGAPNKILVQNNTFYGQGPVNIMGDTDISGSTCGSSNVIIRNNYFITGQPCASQGTASYNVFQTGACGTNAKTCTASFVDSSRLSSGNGDIVANDSCVMSAANPSSYPPTDIHGNERPQGTGPDASANEVG